MKEPIGDRIVSLSAHDVVGRIGEFGLETAQRKIGAKRVDLSVIRKHAHIGVGRRGAVNLVQKRLERVAAYGWHCCERGHEGGKKQRKGVGASVVVGLGVDRGDRQPVPLDEGERYGVVRSDAAGANLPLKSLFVAVRDDAASHVLVGFENKNALMACL